jgi:glycosyltransferase involved in cell wall biosynthesis
MRINYIAYLDPYKYDGGGEKVIRHILDVGREREHDIRIQSVTQGGRDDLHKEPDLNILADIYNSPLSRRRLPEAEIKNIILHKRYVHIDNAYVDVCDMSYLPCNGNATSLCPFKMDRRFDWRRGILRALFDFRPKFMKNRNCFRLHTRELYKHSLLNVFLSPLHRQTVQRIMGDHVIGTYFEYTPHLDSCQFNSQRNSRDIEYLYAGVLCEAKGLEEMRNAPFADDLVLLGAVKAREKVRFGRRMGYLSENDVAAFMARAKRFVFLPRWPEPFGRVVVEAALSGCELVTNEHVGALTFRGEYWLSEEYKADRSTEELWQTIEALAAPR